MAHFGSFVICALFLTFCYPSLADNFLPDEEDPLPLLLKRKPRFIKVYSKGPDPDAELQRGFSNHIKNVLKGGSVSFKFSPIGDYFKRIEKRFPIFSAKEFQRKQNAIEKEKEWEEAEKREDNEYIIDPRMKQ